LADREGALVIDQMIPADWPQVEAIYQQGIATGQATFETDVPCWEEWDRRHLGFARLVARQADKLLGWAALSPVSARPVYAGVAEVSIYIAVEARGRGLGTTLLRVLIEESEQNGIWTLQAGIFQENEASIALHRACGFRAVGRRERVAALRGQWRSTVLMERRSAVVGV
jgi:L-amino acid N-acyltransferase YncA